MIFKYCFVLVYEARSAECGEGGLYLGEILGVVDLGAKTVLHVKDVNGTAVGDLIQRNLGVYIVLPASQKAMT